MKKMTILCGVVALAVTIGVAIAEPDEQVATMVMSTNEVTSTIRCKGLLDSLVVTIQSGKSSTCVVSAVTSQGDILYTNSFTAGTKVYLPVRYQVCNNAGTSLTNWTGLPVVDKKLLLDDVTVKCTTTLATGGNGTNSIIFYLDR